VLISPGAEIVIAPPIPAVPLVSRLPVAIPPVPPVGTVNEIEPLVFTILPTVIAEPVKLKVDELTLVTEVRLSKLALAVSLNVDPLILLTALKFTLVALFAANMTLAPPVMDCALTASDDALLDNVVAVVPLRLLNTYDDTFGAVIDMFGLFPTDNSDSAVATFVVRLIVVLLRF
jgi:hypothetical protein